MDYMVVHVELHKPVPAVAASAAQGGVPLIVRQDLVDRVACIIIVDANVFPFGSTVCIGGSP